MESSNTFEFVSYEYNLLSKELTFVYRLNVGEKETIFTEKLLLPSVPSEEIPAELLDSVLYSLHLILGISYWKLYCPKNILINTKPLSKDQAEFWNMVYTKGLGEFFYKNKIDFRGLINFPYQESAATPSVLFPRSNKSLVGVGGGKDSIVTAELLKEHTKEFTSFIIETQRKHTIPHQVAEIIGEEKLVITRVVDPHLFELNKITGTYNGHIPVSAVYAFIGVLTGILYNYSYFVVSNEKSASYGNVEYLGEIVNHQWSKSLEFEQAFQNYVKSYITESVTYFSLLRPYSEIKITELFVKYPQYFNIFSSCNKNYSLRENNVQSNWCCNCPKCAFVFILMAAFISKEQLLHIFGENLLNKESLINTYKELLGISGIKPFECVGTPEEVQFAFFRTHQKGEFNNDVIMKMFEKEVLPEILNEDLLEKEVYSLGVHAIPQEFQNII